MSLKTPYLGIDYGFGLGEAPGALAEDRFRLATDAAAMKAFATDIYGTSGLLYAWLGGNVPSGNITARVAGGSLALTPSATNYVERTPAGVVSANTTGFTIDGSKIPMAKVTTGATAITAIEDWRPTGSAGGGGASWGAITGALADQADLQAALNGKASSSHTHSGVYAPVTSGTSVLKGDGAGGTTAALANTDFAAATHEARHEPGGADALPWTTIHGRGTTAAKPAAAAGNAGFLYFDTTLGKLQRSTGSAWEDVAEAGSAPAWGGITGTLGDQADLQSALNGKAASSHTHTGVYAPVTSGTSVLKGDGAGGTTAALANTDFAAATHEARHEPGGADALPWTTIHGRGTTAAKPAAAAGNAGFLYFDTTLGKLQRSTGAAWEDVAETVGAGSVAWGAITGTLGDQADLQSALNGKAASSHTHTGVYAPVTSGTSVLKGDGAGGTTAALANTDFAAATHEARHEPGGADALPWTTIHGRGTTAAKPAAAAGNAGYLYFDTTLGKLQRSTGSAWEDVSETGGGSPAWGGITGTLGDQTDLQAALDAKLPKAGGAMTGLLSLASTAAGAGMEIPAQAPTTTTNKLYNDGGSLFFNGVILGGGSGYAYWDPGLAPTSPSSYDDEFDPATSLDAKWTTVNWGNLAAVNVNTTVPSALYARIDSNQTAQSATLQAIPAGDFTICTRVRLLTKSGSTANTMAGIVLSTTNSTGTGSQALVVTALYQTSGDYAGAYTGTNFSNTLTLQANSYEGGVQWLRIRRSGTTYYFGWSTDGMVWVEHTISSLGFTPAYFGLTILSPIGNNAVAFDFFRYFASANAALGGTRIIGIGAGTYMPVGGGTFTGPVKLASSAAGAGLEVPSGVPTTTTDKLYSNAGTPMFSGQPLLRAAPRVSTNSNPASLTPDSDSYDVFVVTGQAQTLTLNNPSGSPSQGQTLIIRIKDNGTGRTLTWSGSYYRAMGVSLPTVTVANKTVYVGLIFNSTDTKWDCVAVAQEV